MKNEYITGENVINTKRACNMKHLNFYVCPVCGNQKTLPGTERRSKVQNKRHKSDFLLLQSAWTL